MAKNFFYLYLVFLLVSLVGNAAADFAILWLGTSLIKDTDLGLNIISSFYLGQAIGYIFIAPYLSSYFSQFAKRYASIVIDSLYIFIYLIVLFLFYAGQLNFLAMLILSTLLAALSSVHKNSITFSLLHKISEKIEIEKVIKSFSYVFSGTLLLGSVISGLLFQLIGFTGCILVALATFFPMLIIYQVVFPKESLVQKTSKIKYTYFCKGFKVLKDHKNLLHSSFGTAIAYIPGAIYPGVIAVYGKEQGLSEKMISIIISLGLFVGLIFIPFIVRLFYKRAYRFSLAVAFIPTIISLLIVLMYKNTWLLGLSFAFNCIGFNILNLISIMVRIKSVNEDEVGTLNTAYFAIMCLGQILGTIILLPLISNYPETALFIMAICYFLSGLYMFFMCTKVATFDLVNR